MSANQRVHTDHAPAAIGPYSQAVIAGELVFTAGQIGLDPARGELVPGGVREQTVQVLSNLVAVLAAAGCGPADVVKTTVYVQTMADFATVNEVYGGTFGDQPPARATVAVADLPLGALVEIEAVARRP